MTSPISQQLREKLHIASQRVQNDPTNHAAIQEIFQEIGELFARVPESSLDVELLRGEFSRIHKVYTRTHSGAARGGGGQFAQLRDMSNRFGMLSPQDKREFRRLFETLSLCGENLSVFEAQYEECSEDLLAALEATIPPRSVLRAAVDDRGSREFDHFLETLSEHDYVRGEGGEFAPSFLTPEKADELADLLIRENPRRDTLERIYELVNGNAPVAEDPEEVTVLCKAKSLDQYSGSSLGHAREKAIVGLQFDEVVPVRGDGDCMLRCIYTSLIAQGKGHLLMGLPGLEGKDFSIDELAELYENPSHPLDTVICAALRKAVAAKLLTSSAVSGVDVVDALQSRKALTEVHVKGLADVLHIKIGVHNYTGASDGGLYYVAPYAGGEEAKVDVLFHEGESHYDLLVQSRPRARLDFEAFSLALRSLNEEQDLEAAQNTLQVAYGHLNRVLFEGPQEGPVRSGLRLLFTRLERIRSEKERSLGVDLSDVSMHRLPLRITEREHGLPCEERERDGEAGILPAPERIPKEAIADACLAASIPCSDGEDARKEMVALGAQSLGVPAGLIDGKSVSDIREAIRRLLNGFEGVPEDGRLYALFLRRDIDAFSTEIERRLNERRS